MNARAALILIVMTLVGSLPAVAGAQTPPDQLEAAILQETNSARQNPNAYADLLEQRLRQYHGRTYRRPDGTRVETKEGKRAVREAIRFLRNTEPVAPLTRLEGLDLAAADHVADQGARGLIGHDGSDGSQPHERVSRHGRWHKITGENIYYGGASATDIVIGFIVDDGVANRGHRTALFHPDFAVTGLSCGPHRSEFETECVVEYAAEFTPAAADTVVAAR